MGKKKEKENRKKKPFFNARMQAPKSDFAGARLYSFNAFPVIRLFFKKFSAHLLSLNPAFLRAMINPSPT